jgi:glutathione S-transferase
MESISRELQKETEIFFNVILDNLEKELSSTKKAYLGGGTDLSLADLVLYNELLNTMALLTSEKEAKLVTNVPDKDRFPSVHDWMRKMGDKRYPMEMNEKFGEELFKFNKRLTRMNT